MVPTRKTALRLALVAAVALSASACAHKPPPAPAPAPAVCKQNMQNTASSNHCKRFC
jgi:hypothetical protein